MNHQKQVLRNKGKLKIWFFKRNIHKHVVQVFLAHFHFFESGAQSELKYVPSKYLEPLDQTASKYHSVRLPCHSVTPFLYIDVLGNFYFVGQTQNDDSNHLDRHPLLGK